MKLKCALILCLVNAAAFAASQADLHVAVYSSGFLVDTNRQVTYGDRARQVKVQTRLHGTAEGEAPETLIEIDRLDQGKRWRLIPSAKTYSEEKYQRSSNASSTSPAASAQPPTLRISAVDTQRSVGSESSTINGLPCKAYTLRLTAKFSNIQTGKVVATETLLQKLWVTESAPEIAKFRAEEAAFTDALTAEFGTEEANFRWLLREFNRSVLELNGNPDDFTTIQKAYREARAQIKGVTVRELDGWNWRPLDPDAPGAQSAHEMTAFVAAIAGGLGAPPSTEGKSAISDQETPKWVRELSNDLGRTGPSALILEEVIKARSAAVKPAAFEIPVEYRKSK
jgi:hypothetical protein